MTLRIPKGYRVRHFVNYLSSNVLVFQHVVGLTSFNFKPLNTMTAMLMILLGLLGFWLLFKLVSVFEKI